GENGRIAIPRGSNAELMVRVAPDNDLILDLESVVVNGQRFAVRADPNRVESQRDNSLFGALTETTQWSLAGSIHSGNGSGNRAEIRSSTPEACGVLGFEEAAILSTPQACGG